MDLLFIVSTRLCITIVDCNIYILNYLFFMTLPLLLLISSAVGISYTRYELSPALPVSIDGNYLFSVTTESG